MKPNYESSNGILQAAREIGLAPKEFRQAGTDQWADVLRRVFDRFVGTYKTDIPWIWANLKQDYESVQLTDSLNHIKSFCDPQTKVWLLIEDSFGTKRQGNYWVFECTYDAALAVLNNMNYVEYYIVDPKITWMILENHHSFVTGVGEPAKSFVRSLVMRQ